MPTAYTGPGIDIALPAAADLTASQFCFVTVDASGNAALCATDGQKALGVLQNRPKTGEGAIIRVFGPSKALAGGALVAGTQVKTDATGKSTAGATAKAPLGLVLQGAASGDVTTILVNCGYVNQ
jgi:hypothetical protein